MEQFMNASPSDQWAIIKIIIYVVVITFSLVAIVVWWRDILMVVHKFSQKTKKKNSMRSLLILCLFLFPISSFAQEPNEETTSFISQEEVNQFIEEGYFIRSYPAGENILDNELLMKEYLALEISFNTAVEQDSTGILQQLITQAKELYLVGVFKGGYEFMTTKGNIGVLEYDLRKRKDVNDFFTMIFNRSESENLYLKDDDANFCIIRPGGIFPYIGDIEKLSMLNNTKFTNFVVWLEESSRIK